eukprot:scaffold185310_cov14-Prasinocladus_malaysianus.AAC.1
MHAMHRSKRFPCATQSCQSGNFNNTVWPTCKSASFTPKKSFILSKVRELRHEVIGRPFALLSLDGVVGI